MGKVYPAMAACFWCGAPKNKLVLLKDQKTDPGHMPKVCVDYEPCYSCKLEMASKIVIMEVGPPNPTRPAPEIKPGIVPTGRWLTVAEPDCLIEHIGEENAARVVLSKLAFMEEAIFEKFLPEDQRKEVPDGGPSYSA